MLYFFYCFRKIYFHRSIRKNFLIPDHIGIDDEQVLGAGGRHDFYISWLANCLTVCLFVDRLEEISQHSAVPLFNLIRYRSN